MATQDEINSFVEQIMPYFDPTPVEDDAVQQSWPRLDRGLSDVQDMTRFQQLYGIFDRGGRPFWLRGHATDAETNSKNTMFLTVSTTTGTAESTIRGAFHRVREDIELEFPAVSSPTTQYVVDEYDPIRAEDGGDPIVSRVVTNLDRSQGKEYIVHWEVDRRPSQLLTDAPKRQVRPKVAPTITVDTDEQRLAIPTRALLWGTLCLVHSTGEMWRAMGSSADEQSGGPTGWRSVTDPDWVEYGDTPTYVWPGHGERRAIQRAGKRRRLRGRVSSRDGSAMTPSTTGYLVWTCADGDIPGMSSVIPVASSASSSPKAGVIRTQKGDPEIRLFPKDSMVWVDLAPVSWDV